MIKLRLSCSALDKEIEPHYNGYVTERSLRNMIGGSMYYTLAELALITGYSTRSLRSFYRQGLLGGAVAAGKYSFSEEDVELFMAQPFIKAGLETKFRMQVQYFLDEEHREHPVSCLIHDEPDRAPQKYQERMGRYLSALRTMNQAFVDIRRQAYITGAVYQLVCADCGEETRFLEGPVLLQLKREGGREAERTGYCTFREQRKRAEREKGADRGYRDGDIKIWISVF